MRKLDDGFKQLHRITDDEEKFFDYIYKRERLMKATITVLIVVIIALSVWMLLQKQ